MNTISDWRDSMNALGGRLKIARIRRRWSQQSMADRMGVTRQTLDRLERGLPSVRLETLAAALRVLSFPVTELDAIADLGRDVVGLSLELARAPRAKRGKVDPEDAKDFWAAAGFVDTTLS